MSADSDSARARYGWQSDFPTFADEEPRVVRISLQEFLADAGESQVRAWDDSIPQIQVEVGEVVEIDELADQYTAILEYELPLESRRPDVVLLVSGAVVVLELKGKAEPEQADLDQAAAYARDLRCYHKHCADREVHAVVVPTRAHGYAGVRDGVHIAGPDALHELIQKLQRPWARGRSPPRTSSRRTPTARYRRWCRRRENSSSTARYAASTAPGPTPSRPSTSYRTIAHEAARTRTRHLVLVAGVPGSGKTLVGLSAVHSTQPRLTSPSSGPAASQRRRQSSCSGNGPLVEVLQYELRSAGGGGKTFVRDVKNYVKQYLGDKAAIPPQHVIVYDEAQRAWDPDRCPQARFPSAVSEPEAFVEFGERIPEWCVLVGLIGTGQEIHIGEEAGLGQWREALEKASYPGCMDGTRAGRGARCRVPEPERRRSEGRVRSPRADQGVALPFRGRP